MRANNDDFAIFPSLIV